MRQNRFSQKDNTIRRIDRITSHQRGLYISERPVKDPQGVLVYIHGLGESGLCFEHLLAHAGLGEWHQIILDLPGYGRSLRMAEPLSLSAHADYLAAWLRDDALTENKMPIVVIGHSMGGVVGLLLCERHPDLGISFVNVEGNISTDDCQFSAVAAAQEVEAFLDGGFDKLRNRIFAEGEKDPAKQGYYVSLRLADPRAFYLNSVELVEVSAGEHLAARLAAVVPPVCYLAGVPDGLSQRSKTLLTQAGVGWTAIEPAGHWPFLDQPDQFVSALRNQISF
jgi:pimeloyl-ACP methyl ester carboxylesterase